VELPKQKQSFRSITIVSRHPCGLRFSSRGVRAYYIEVQSGNTRFLEMHVDGAVTSNVLAVPEFCPAAKDRAKCGKAKSLHYCQWQDNAGLCDDGRWYLSIVARSFYSTVKANTRSTLIATYDFARRNGWQFRLAAIRPDHAITSTTFNFHTDYMRGLFNLGFSTARTGQPWQRSPQSALTPSRRHCWLFPTPTEPGRFECNAPRWRFTTASTSTTE
jgi:hypothetical protein